METKRKFREHNSINEESKEMYGFYVRLKDRSRNQMRFIRDKMTDELGRTPSNPMILEKLMGNWIYDHVR
jgi:hypothetical protein